MPIADCAKHFVKEEKKSCTLKLRSLTVNEQHVKEQSPHYIQSIEFSCSSRLLFEGIARVPCDPQWARLASTPALRKQ
eukprot:2141174-Pyramimonas_sp.AAC.1